MAAIPTVKFYSRATMPSENIDPNGLYFIQGGELYKGSQRFGLGRVTTASTEEAFGALEGMVRGDINVGYQGAKVYDGSAWQPLGGDIASLQSSWRADISTWLSGLSVGDSTSYVTNITQDANGKVTANLASFPTLDEGDADGQIKLGSVNASVSGWSGLVGRVSDIESIVDFSNSSVSATSGTFSELMVTSTATFNVATVSADTLTINGSTVEQIADKQIAAISEATSSSSSNGIVVGVTTEAGSIKAVTVNASAFGNAMHFRDVVSNTADVSDAMPGDIVIIGSNADTGFVSGQEYICTASATTEPAEDATWELIGDQNSYALNAYSSSATVYTEASSLAGALDAAGNAIDTLNASVSALSNSLADMVGGSSSSTNSGVTVSVAIDASSMAPSVDLVVDHSELWASLSLGTVASANLTNSIDPSSRDVPTAEAVAAYVSEALQWVTE